MNRIPVLQWRHIANINPDDYAELQQQPNIDSRPDGGFINPDNARPRDRRMRWDPAADRELLIFGFGRDIHSSEYKILAERYEQKPTEKAIQERITKLRVETRRVLKETGIFDPERLARPPPPGGAPPRAPATPGNGLSSPAPGSAKKATPVKKTVPAKKGRPASGGPKSKGSSFPPETCSPAARSQPPPGSSARPMGQQGLPSFQPPSTGPLPGPAWAPRFPPGAPVATMFPPPAGAPQAPGSQMGMPPPGATTYPPYRSLYGALPPFSPAGPGMSGYHYQQQQQLPTFAEPYPPTLPAQQPAGAGANPPVRNRGGAAEGEQEDPMVRSERELKEKKAKRDAVR